MMHVESRNAAEATRLAQAKIEELAKLDFATAPAIQITGTDSLNADVPNYFDAPIPGLVLRRWQVQAGPSPTGTTRLVTVRVINRQGSLGARTVDLTTVLREW